MLLADGLSYADIAQRWTVALSTVRGHVLEVYRRLCVPNGAAAVGEAARRGWLGWMPLPTAEPERPLSVEHPYLAAYLSEFDKALAQPGRRATSEQRLAMDAALLGHRASRGLPLHTTRKRETS